MFDPARLDQLSNASVLVIGDVMLDRYFIGDTNRISPEAPVPVVRIGHTEDRAGGAANVARNIAHLDGKASLLGIIGNDSDGRLLQDLLVQEKVHSELLSLNDARTISKTRILSRHQQMVRLDMEDTFAESQSEQLSEHFTRLVQQYDTVILSDYAKGTLASVRKLIDTARAAGKRVLVDPKTKDFSKYRGATIITPNLTEFRAAGGDDSSEEAMLASARNILNTAGIEIMLLTRSEQGMSLITPDEHHHFPAEVLEVSDVTGAGDTVIATLGTLLSAGFELSDAAWLANLAAGIVVAKLGAATVSPEELAAKASHQLSSKNSGYHPSTEQSLLHIDYARQQGERIVFTNGCFDILHAGHVRYLAQARALGDRLVVGLNSDASVRRLKGDERPVNNLEDRMEVLAALACVDWVIPFGDTQEENDTPEQLIRRVQPQVLAKGGDYTVDTVVGADFVQENGGEVAILPTLEGRSTTGLIDKVRG
ncbi:D-alpha,beta-D-heptose 7-phosphate 1-kinase /D-beta-D-heptose 1-phosphate adenylyltransferase [Marinobacter persicus]|uniref:Bifunctional protein HldE n=2 Tax=Marinobacter persicus TaxID=930118 RepID=A0A1I3X898_9GAMM|nr:bifunctional D-glycero-beta-D-manno-heptose-7-phosphate kinase/D-glycero-beta-D-manno-heptose 1-phosphate adenylyltransferase HldE [Marinobacter persicus]GHD48862.1 bifunctional protein HldE [Marinobacter persicus]SFK15992.1 D-alpha,beta-D-heptose 7-phosphate 1-kinase /D-beta-D-heptose 1-phosphate adenylyltransferase [Marinobacter persicus]